MQSFDEIRGYETDAVDGQTHPQPIQAEKWAARDARLFYLSQTSNLKSDEERETEREWKPFLSTYAILCLIVYSARRKS